MIKPTTLKDFYKKTFSSQPDRIEWEPGHFNVFRIKDLNRLKPVDARMFFNRKSFYKIALLDGNTTVKYADREIIIENSGLLFADPNNPYQFESSDLNDGGYFCIFSDDFILNNPSKSAANPFPIFKSNIYPVFNISVEQKNEVKIIFEHMYQEISSEYLYKYDLLRSYLAQLLHYGQKLLPEIVHTTMHQRSQRISELFSDLLEQQFSIHLPIDRLGMRFPKDYAKKMGIHVNYLNKKLQEATGQSTTELLNDRILKEAKILLKHSEWTISQIAYGLGFQDGSHFSKFFKKHIGHPPQRHRNAQ